MRKLPEGWEWTRLGDISENYDNRRVPVKESDRASRRGPYPYCGANGIIDFIDDFIFDGEYVLLAEDGGNWGPGGASAYLMGGKFWVNNHAHILEGKEGIITNAFLAKALNHYDLNQFITGTTRGKLTKESMNNVLLPVPPLDTQRKIVAILDKAEETRRLRAQANELTQTLLQSIFLEMFGDPVKNLKKWPTLRLNELVEPIYCRSPSDSRVPVFRYIDIDSIDNVTNVVKEPKKIPSDEAPSRARQVVKKNDILFSTVRPYLRNIAIVTDDLSGEIASTGFCVLRPSKTIDTPYFFHLLLSETFLESLRVFYRGANYPAISQSNLLETTVPYPPENLRGPVAKLSAPELLAHSQLNQVEQRELDANLVFSAVRRTAF